MILNNSIKFKPRIMEMIFDWVKVHRDNKYIIFVEADL